MRSQPKILTMLSIAGFSILALGLAAGAFHQVPPAMADSGDGWLGIQLQNLDSDLREAQDLDSDLRGVLVSRVIQGSPADRAGIRRGDVITEVDEEKVRNSRAVVNAVRDREPGDKILVVVHRDGSSRGLSVVLGDREDRNLRFGAPVDKDVRNHFEGPENRFERRDNRRSPRAGIKKDKENREDDEDHDGHHVWRWDSGDDDDDVVIELRDPKRDRKHIRIHPPAPPRVRAEISGGFLGVQTMGLNEQLAEYFGVDGDEGVLVTEVVKDSPAESAGLLAGDVILKVAGRDIEDSRDLRRAVRRMDPDEEVEVQILRKGSRKTLKVTLGDARDFGSLAPEAPDFGDLETVLPGLGRMEIEIPEIEFPEMPDIEALLENLSEIEFEDGGVKVFIRGFDDEAAARVKRDLKRFKDHDLKGLRESMRNLRQVIRHDLRNSATV